MEISEVFMTGSRHARDGILRAAARVVESQVELDGDGGEGLDDQVWARLEALPDPHSPQGRIYPLASLHGLVN